MLLIQEFLSLEEIGEEYYSGLDKLLKEQIPNIDWAIKRKFNKRHIKFEYYHLYFTNKSSNPIGISHLMCEEIPIKKILKFSDSLMIRATHLNSKIKILSGNLFNLKKAYFFDPLYEKDGEEQFKKIISKIEERSHIDLKFINHRPGIDFSFSQSSLSFSDNWHDTIYKNRENYTQFISALPLNEFQHIKELWDNIGRKDEIELKDYKNFRSIFEKYQSDPTFKDFVPSAFQIPELSLIHSSYTVCSNKMHFLGLTIFYSNEEGTLFCEIFCSREYLYLHYHYVIRKFFEYKESRRLIFLNLDYFRDTYQKIIDKSGISIKKRQITASTSSFAIAKKIEPLIERIRLNH